MIIYVNRLGEPSVSTISKNINAQFDCMLWCSACGCSERRYASFHFSKPCFYMDEMMCRIMRCTRCGIKSLVSSDQKKSELDVQFHQEINEDHVAMYPYADWLLEQFDSPLSEIIQDIHVVGRLWQCQGFAHCYSKRSVAYNTDRMWNLIKDIIKVNHIVKIWEENHYGNL